MDQSIHAGLCVHVSNIGFLVTACQWDDYTPVGPPSHLSLGASLPHGPSPRGLSIARCLKLFQGVRDDMSQEYRARMRALRRTPLRSCGIRPAAHPYRPGCTPRATPM
jgi:hypothetical protein